MPSITPVPPVAESSPRTITASSAVLPRSSRWRASVSAQTGELVACRARARCDAHGE